MWSKCFWIPTELESKIVIHIFLSFCLPQPVREKENILPLPTSPVRKRKNPLLLFPLLQWDILNCQIIQFSLVQFSCSVVSKSLQSHKSHTRPPCPSPTPRACSNSCPSSRWCHQPSHPLSSPSPPALNLSQHQGLFQWVSSSHEVAKVLEFQLQHQSFQWTPRTDLL